MDLIIVSVLVLVLIVTVVCGVWCRLALDSVSHKDPFEPKTGIRKRVNGEWVTEWVRK